MKNELDPSSRSNAKRYGLRRPKAKISWHDVSGVAGVLPREPHATVPGPLTGLPGAGLPVEREAQDLAVQQRQVLGGVVAAGPAACGSRPGVTDRDVQEAVGGDVEVAAVVVAADRRDVVEQHHLAARHHLLAGEREAGSRG